MQAIIRKDLVGRVSIIPLYLTIKRHHQDSICSPD